jgi:hypothetical protein
MGKSEKFLNFTMEKGAEDSSLILGQTPCDKIDHNITNLLSGQLATPRVPPCTPVHGLKSSKAICIPILFIKEPNLCPFLCPPPSKKMN